MTNFDQRSFQSALTTAAIGRPLVYHREVDTTMRIARGLADAGATHGTLVLAERQTAGRGRRGRTFHSPDTGNLYFTLILRFEPTLHRRLPVALPVAVARACAAVGLDPRIKWPNDIWAGERKLCGMLIDAEIGGEGAVALAGIGVNVNGDPTVIPELKDSATSVSRELGRTVSRELLLAAICTEIEAVAAWPEGRLAHAYRDLSLVLGREVALDFPDGSRGLALAEGIAPDGELIVRNADGSLARVRAADVSLRPVSPAEPDSTPRARA